MAAVSPALLSAITVGARAGSPFPQFKGVRDSAFALNDVVVGRPARVGSVLEITVQGAVDDFRFPCHHRVRRETERCDLLRPNVVHEDVGLFNQAPQGLARRFTLQIEHDTALVAVAAEVGGRHALVPGGADAARDVAFRRFDLDNFGAEVSEQLGGVGAEQHAREIEHNQPRIGQVG